MQHAVPGTKKLIRIRFGLAVEREPLICNELKSGSNIIANSMTTYSSLLARVGLRQKNRLSETVDDTNSEAISPDGEHSACLCDFGRVSDFRVWHCAADKETVG